MQLNAKRCTLNAVTLEEFQKVELKIGKIAAAERVAGSEKLLKLQVDLGGPDLEHPDVRQIISGIAKQYAPEDLIGKEVTLVVNLESRMMMGMASQGMMLCAHGEDGEPVVLLPEKPVPPGAEIT